MTDICGHTIENMEGCDFTKCELPSGHDDEWHQESDVHPDVSNLDDFYQVKWKKTESPQWAKDWKKEKPERQY